MKDIYINKDIQAEQEEKLLFNPFKIVFIIILICVFIVIGLGYYIVSGGGQKNINNVKTATEEMSLYVRNKTSGDYTYELNYEEIDGDKVANSATLTSYLGTEEIVEIPKTIDEYEVTRIGNSCFAHNNMASVNIPGSVVEIENFAFYDCENLRLVEFTNDRSDMSLKLGDSAFSGCSELVTVTFPHDVLEIGNIAFQSCHKLVEVNFDYNCTLTIGMCAFQNCDIKKLVLPKNTKAIGNYAFEYNNSLSAFVIPNDCEVGKDITQKSSYNRRYVTTTRAATNTASSSSEEYCTTIDEDTSISQELSTEEYTTESSTENTTKRKRFFFF